ncbi:MAG: pyridoxal-phosphate dependent enzyme [Bacteroidales bacterium]|nr:pyridoxal-phosphate dependent enzyme [Bacteroidales bacterium]
MKDWLKKSTPKTNHSEIDMIPDLPTIEAAAERIRPYVHRTPVLTSEGINHLLNSTLFFKCENLQKAGAFKSRGACNAVFSLPDDLVSSGVATHSSGNHAQALARAARIRGCKAYIVMPETAPRVKVEAVKGYGGEITFCQPTLASREETLRAVVEKTGATEVHPYNDYRIIAGQATAALEFFNQTGNLDIIMTPVGGGGLLSGTALSTRYLSPSTQVIAAEPANADDAFRSFNTKQLLPSVNPNTIADGLLTSLGTLTFPIILDYVYQIITASEASIIEAMKLTWERMKIIIEPSSALPLAVIMENRDIFKGKKVGIILSGGNVSLHNLPWLKQTRP